MRKKVILTLAASFVFLSLAGAAFPQGPVGENSTYRGDIREDGRIDIFDLLALLKVLSSGEFESDRQRIVANVDKSEDGRVNIFDLLALLQVLAGVVAPDLITWGPPDISSVAPPHASPGDTLEIFLENVAAGAEITVLLDEQQVAFLGAERDKVTLVLPEDFIGGLFAVVAGIDTTGSRFVNIPNPDPPVIAGCSIFPADNPWNQPVEGFPVHPNSENYVKNIGYAPLHPDFGSSLNYGIPFVVVGGEQPRVPLSFTYWDECDPGPYPIPEDPPIEGGESSTGDRHVLVLDSTNCMLYETFSTYYEGPGWRAGSGAVFELGSNALRPDTWTSSDAAGLPILPGLVRYEEVAAGEVNHAIRFTVEESQRAYVYPATHFASSSYDTDRPPMGLRVRLKASYDLSGFSGQALVIARALKKYGMIVADNGGDWFFTGASDTRWNDGELDQLKRISGNYFEVVDASAMVVSGKDERRNIWPAVSVTAPAEGAAFAAGADIAITATCADNDGSVVLVEFFQGTTRLGQDISAPYEFTWSGAAEGTSSITARATDNGAAVNTSYPVTITVSSGI